MDSNKRLKESFRQREHFDSEVKEEEGMIVGNKKRLHEGLTRL